MIKMIKSDGTCRNRGAPCLLRNSSLCVCSIVNKHFKAGRGKDCSDHYVYVKADKRSPEPMIQIMHFNPMDDIEEEV